MNSVDYITDKVRVKNEIRIMSFWMPHLIVNLNVCNDLVFYTIKNNTLDSLRTNTINVRSLINL